MNTLGGQLVWLIIIIAIVIYVFVDNSKAANLSRHCPRCPNCGSKYSVRHVTNWEKQGKFLFICERCGATFNDYDK